MFYTVIFEDLTLDKEDRKHLYRSFNTLWEAEAFAQELEDMGGNHVVDIEEEDLYEVGA